MEQERNTWMDVLSEQDIPAEVVDWESIVKTGEDEESYDHVNPLDAEAIPNFKETEQ
ncbi:hypothetical protein [Paenibacillus sp. sgz5001063]|uniref:hypothetical protein n=1 Tax=Paenibacillus sp. sgz5001063 TaxID=3242474 RepID=UPI0036D2231F